MKSVFVTSLIRPAIFFAVVMTVLAGLARATTLHLGERERVITKDQRTAKGLNYWPDGSMGVLKTGSLYSFVGAGGTGAGDPTPLSVTVGSLDNPLLHDVHTDVVVSPMKEGNDFDYVGGGPIYRDPASGTLLMFYHAERWPLDENDEKDGTKFYASIGMAKSTNNGTSWSDLGEIIRPYRTMASVNNAVPIGGNSYAIVGNYFYVYFRERLDDTPQGGIAYNNLVVARALVADVVSEAITEDGVVAWEKYDGGWNGSAGIGGLSSALEDGNPSCVWSSVSYNSHLNKYILIAIKYRSLGGAAFDMDVEYADSDDGLAWSARQVIDNTGDIFMYPTLIGLGSEPAMTGSQFYVYYTSSVAGGWQTWSDAHIVRKRVSVAGSLVGGSLFTQASGSFGSSQGALNGWRYQEKSGGTYTDMVWDNAGYWKGSTSAATQIRESVQVPDTTDAVRVWRAPRPGTVRISLRARKADSGGGDGVNVEVLKNSTSLWSQAIADGDMVGYDWTSSETVAAGDDIRFVVNRGTSTSTDDATELDPQVYFTPTDNFVASAGFSGTQGNNQWNYQSWNGSAYTDLPNFGSAKWSTGSDTYLMVAAGTQHPGVSLDAVRTWTAPSTGYIAITGNIRKSNTGGGDGVSAKIFRNTTQLGSTYNLAYNDSTGINVNLTTAVTAGDKIHFRLNKGASTNSFDGTAWDPAITYYTPTDIFTASKGFSGLQGLGQWSYKKWTSGGGYVPIENYNFGGAYWQGTGDTWLQVLADAQHPGASADSVRTWIAPVAGKIRITFNGNIRKKNTTGGDGVVAKIFHNATQLGSTYNIAYNDGTGYDVDPAIGEFAVAAGDAIHFRLNKGAGTNSSDGTYWDPVITYKP